MKGRKTLNKEMICGLLSSKMCNLTAKSKLIIKEYIQQILFQYINVLS